MIFSHAPLGFITTYIASQKYKEKITKKQNLWIFLVGTLFAIFPDFDLFYYYFISASETHRVMITHTPLPYVLMAVILFCLGLFLKNKFVKLLSLIIILSSFSHLVLDSLGSGVAWFYPLNKLPYGLLSFSQLAEGFYGHNFFAINYSIEFIILAVFFSLLLILKFNNLRKVIIVLSSFVVISAVFVLFYLNQYLFSINSNNYYGDVDVDGVMNMRDLDMDGDSILNLNDSDANGNKRDNLYDLIETARSMKGVYYDKTEEGFYGLFSRFGFLSNIDVVYKSYDYAGIFLKSEIKEDFEKNPEKYIGDPDNDYLFNDRVENLYIYCKNKEFIVESDYDYKKGDIIFYKNEEKINHVSLLVEGSGFVIDAGIDNKIIKTEIDNVKNKFGKEIINCRILN